MTYQQNRTGQGRWATVLAPHPGILWTNDADSIGFQPIGKVAAENGPDGIIDYDGADLRELIDDLHAAGKTATDAFNLLAKLHGQNLQAGDLATWKPAKMRRRPVLADTPAVTSATEVMEIVKDADS